MIEATMGLLEGATWLAVLGAALWGLASVLLSPCHLTSVPLLVGFLGRVPGQALSPRALSAWVTAGLSASLVVIAGVSLGAGRILGDLWGVGPWLMVAFLVGTGLVLLGAVDLPSIGQLRPERARAGAGGAAAAGGVLGVTLGPCTFGFFAPLFAFGAGAAALPLKAATLGAFVAAHLAATWAVGLLGARVAGWLSHSGAWARAVKGLVGVAAIAVAIDLILTAP